MFLSLIIPVYNAEGYIAKCLDSLLNQDLTAQDYEIICVNDGSRDNSLAVLERYAAEHSNIKSIKRTAVSPLPGMQVWMPPKVSISGSLILTI